MSHMICSTHSPGFYVDSGWVWVQNDLNQCTKTRSYHRGVGSGEIPVEVITLCFPEFSSPNCYLT